MLWLCEKGGYQRPVISQPMYNLLARGIEQEYVPFCKEFGISMVVYNPLARGLLTGKQERDASRSNSTSDGYQSSLDRYQHPAYFDAVDELRGIAARAAGSMIDLSVNWLLHHTATDCAILGAWNAEQLDQTLDVFDRGPLTADTVADCDAVWQRLRGVMPKYNR